MQLVELAQHLSRASIKFQFDPMAVGLTQDMTIKYFLNQFQLDLGDSEANLKQKRIEIREFFSKLSEYNSPEKEEEEEEEEGNRGQSMSTNGSLTPAD